MRKPPDRSQECDPSENDAVIIHRRGCDWHGVGKAEDDVEENNRDERNGVNSVSPLAHPYQESIRQ